MATLKNIVETIPYGEVIELRDKNGSKSMCRELWEEFGVMNCNVEKLFTIADEFFNFPILVIEIDGIFDV